MTRVVTFGEIMGRMATPGHQRFRQAMPGTLQVTFAGAEASVAASIAYLGGDAAFVTALPDHAIADACVADLRSLGLDTRFILRTPSGRLGLYFLEAGANQRPSNVVYDRGESSVAITPADAYDWDAIFRDVAWFVISGITPAISRNAAEVTEVALREASDRGVRVAFDMNYRGKLWRWDPSVPPRELAMRTIRELMPRVDLFVGGREDIEAVLGFESGSNPDTPSEQLAHAVGDQFPRVTRVAMTIRHSPSATENRYGGMLYDRQAERAWFGPGEGEFYPIARIVDRIGTGDAFTAGLLFALTTPGLDEPQTAIRFAAAAGCLAHSIEGDFNFTRRDEVEALMTGDRSGRVNR